MWLEWLLVLTLLIEKTGLLMGPLLVLVACRTSVTVANMHRQLVLHPNILLAC